MLQIDDVTFFSRLISSQWSRTVHRENLWLGVGSEQPWQMLDARQMSDWHRTFLHHLSTTWNAWFYSRALAHSINGWFRQPAHIYVHKCHINTFINTDTGFLYIFLLNMLQSIWCFNTCSFKFSIYNAPFLFQGNC